MTTATKLNVGRRLDETEKRLAAMELRCALIGWPDARRQLLVDGADFRDLLRGDAPQIQCGSSPRLKAVKAR